MWTLMSNIPPDQLHYNIKSNLCQYNITNLCNFFVKIMTKSSVTLHATAYAVDGMKEVNERFSCGQTIIQYPWIIWWEEAIKQEWDRLLSQQKKDTREDVLFVLL